jgi:hypothetical protein
MRRLSKKERQRLTRRFKDWQHKSRNGFKEIHGKTMNFVTYSYEENLRENRTVGNLGEIPYYKPTSRY